MFDFGPKQLFCPKFQNAISRELQRVRCWNFQGILISLTPINGPKMKEFWDQRVSSFKFFRWFDVELPFCYFGFLWLWCAFCKLLCYFSSSFRQRATMSLNFWFFLCILSCSSWNSSFAFVQADLIDAVEDFLWIITA